MLEIGMVDAPDDKDVILMTAAMKKMGRSSCQCQR